MGNDQPYYPPPQGQQGYYPPPQGAPGQQYYQPQPPPNAVYVQQQDQNRGGDHNCCMACLIGCLACCALESLCDMCC
ncbi:hypothetical protein O0I10_007456 [Lichtheimia ornata]|uniref:Cysteine-rich transmembrane CYSTM domain-containing protein n=1 Tax=Lichtheimia ornata TaxID=688661 RepID=A0AAD7V064_9FUNG|nr:uncharacterized protein O0I10_007456 [Lichtheimia ornata]KAJ8656859.1 hypothetical protein O0I10_007456 [Lichtheimia ornata]